jgi:hypothetical protein
MHPLVQLLYAKEVIFNQKNGIKLMETWETKTKHPGPMLCSGWDTDLDKPAIKNMFKAVRLSITWICMLTDDSFYPNHS